MEIICVFQMRYGWVGGAGPEKARKKQKKEQIKQPSIMAIEANTVALWTAF